MLSHVYLEGGVGWGLNKILMRMCILQEIEIWQDHRLATVEIVKLKDVMVVTFIDAFEVDKYGKMWQLNMIFQYLLSIVIVMWAELMRRAV